MFVPEGLKLNKFHNVAIPRNAEYFARYGFTASAESQYSGDQPAPMPKNKTDVLADMDVYDKMKQREEDSKTD